VSINFFRLSSGLVMLAYLVTHLTNHAMGLVSLAAMEATLAWVSTLWSLPPLQLLLYGSFAVHFTLGLVGLWQRRTLRLPPIELLRIALGFAIPILLLRHVIAARPARVLFGTDLAHYSYFLWVYFVRSPASGLQQLTVLVMAWAHGMVGVHFWLKFRPWYRRIGAAPVLFAVIVPIAALLGTFEAGRSVAALATRPGWIATQLGPRALPTPAAQHSLDTIVQIGTWLLLAAPIGLLLARSARGFFSSRRGLIRISYPDRRYVDVAAGTSVLEASRLGGIPHSSICGGRGRCSTCRVRVRVTGPGALDPPSDSEARVLRHIRAIPNVRLACQLRSTCDIEVTPLLPPLAAAEDGRQPIDIALGTERIVAILFVDIRGFTGLAERRLPYDVVFILNRYFATAGRAVETAGGRIDKFIGDGMMALFGVDGSAEHGCRNALVAARLLSDSLREFNAALAADIGEPLRIGIGLHVGSVIIGEIGYRASRQMTAIGDAVNIASRLEVMAKAADVELVLSEDTANRAGVDLSAFPLQRIEIRGRGNGLSVRFIERAAIIPV
jgi:adenylate cyclase